MIERNLERQVSEFDWQKEDRPGFPDKRWLAPFGVVSFCLWKCQCAWDRCFVVGGKRGVSVSSNLALEAEVSARHLSFLETGRAKPSRDMLLTLANVLDVPLRERNVLLLAAGYAPIYTETSLDDPRMSQVRAAIEIMLRSNEPRAAVAHDRYWNVVLANAAFVRLLTIVLGKAPAGLSAMQLASRHRVNLRISSSIPMACAESS
jgi:transcriptional regulator with XRE-family HTH domain